MKKVAIAITVAAAIAAAPAMANPNKGCPGSVARNSGNVAGYVAFILELFGNGRIFGERCSPN
jgi:hypothetical protein